MDVDAAVTLWQGQGTNQVVEYSSPLTQHPRWGFSHEETHSIKEVFHCNINAELGSLKVLLSQYNDLFCHEFGSLCHILIQDQFFIWTTGAEEVSVSLLSAPMFYKFMFPKKCLIIKVMEPEIHLQLAFTVFVLEL